MADMSEPHEELTTRLNLETGRLEWTELQRHFARGIVLVVSRDLDLVEAGATLIRDDKDTVAAWKDQGRLRPAGDADARRWQSENAGFWALVIAPWVVVQEAGD